MASSKFFCWTASLIAFSCALAPDWPGPAAALAFAADFFGPAIANNHTDDLNDQQACEARSITRTSGRAVSAFATLRPRDAAVDMGLRHRCELTGGVVVSPGPTGPLGAASGGA